MTCPRPKSGYLTRLPHGGRQTPNTEGRISKARVVRLPLPHSIFGIRCSLLGLLFLCSAFLVPAAAPALADEDALDKTRKLFGEEQRQVQVNQRLKAVITGLDALMEDLRSNGLFKQIQGERMDRMKTILQKVTKEHVPNAAEYLRKARQELAALRESLAGADKEIQIILAELEKILGRAISSMQMDNLLSELREIIKEQEQVQNQTKEWGTPILEGKKPDEPKAKQIANAQEQVGKRVEAFKEKPKQAAAQETDPATKSRLEKADKALKDKPLKENVAEAVKDVQEKKPVGAVQEQEKVLQALREAEKALQDDSSSQDQQQNNELAGKIENIVQQVKTMAAEIQNASPQDFQAQKPDWQVQQAEIQNQLNEAAEKAGEPQKEPMDKAKKSMEKAQSELAESHQEPTVAALNEVVEALSPQVAMMQQKKITPTPPQPLNPNPEEGPRTHQSSTKVEGTTTAPGDSQLSPLSRQQREALFENYVNQLPAEYRELLRAYYEALSK